MQYPRRETWTNRRLVRYGVEQADTLARALVESRLAACVNLVPGVKLPLLERGGMPRTGVPVADHTRAENFEPVRRRIRELHPTRFRDYRSARSGRRRGLPRWLRAVSRS